MTQPPIGLVTAEPRYLLRCWLRGHKRALFCWNGLRLPWCQTCREREERE